MNKQRNFNLMRPKVNMKHQYIIADRILEIIFMGTPTKIRNLKVGMKDVDVKGKVNSKSNTMEVYSRFGNKVNRVANAIIADDSGSIKLILWNEQIDGLEVGDTIQIDNGHVTIFRGEKQLNVGKRTGKLSIIGKASQS